MLRRTWLIGAAVMGAVAIPRWSTAETLVVPESFQLGRLPERTDSPVVTALAISPNGRYLAAAGDDHAIRILRLPEHEEIALLKGHEDWVRALHFSPNGNYLASAGNDGQIRRWETEAWNGQRLITADSSPATIRSACLQTLNQSIESLCVSPCSGFVSAVGFQPNIHCITATGSVLAEWECDGTDLRFVRYDPAQQVVVAGGRSGILHVFDLQSGDEDGEYKLHTRRIRDAVFIPNSDQVVTVGEDGKAVMFDLSERRVQAEIQLERVKLVSVVAVDQNHVATGGTDNKIHFLDVRSGYSFGALEGHLGTVAALAVQGNNLYSAGFDTTIHHWDLGGIEEDDRVAGPALPVVGNPEARTSRAFELPR